MRAAFCAIFLLVLLSLSSSQIMEDELFRAYTEINQLQRELDLSLSLPRLAIMGIQSAGKSSLLETYAGFSLAYTSSSTGTRCPVEYTMRFDPNQEEPLITVLGEVVSKERLCELTASHMRSIESRSRDGFSHEVLRVQISYKNTPNIVITDLPGITPSAENPQRQAVARIVQFYVRDPSYSLIAVLKCTEGSHTLSDIQLIDEMMTEDLTGERMDDVPFPPPRSNWKSDTVMVVNKINMIMNDRALFDDIPTASKWFKDQQADVPRYFVALKPDLDFIREKAKPEEIEEFLKNFPQNEKALFSKFKSDIQQRSQITARWPSDIDDMWTVANAKKAIMNLWMKTFVQSLPSLISRIQELLSTAKKEDASLQETIALMDPERYSNDLRRYALNFVKAIFSLHTSTMMRTEKGQDINNFLSTEDYTFRPSTHGMDFEEELDAHEIQAMRLWRYVIPFKALLSTAHLDGHVLGDVAKLKLVGSASLDRLVKMLSYYMYNAGMDQMSDDDIYGQAFDGNQANVFSSAKVVSQMVRAQLMKLEDGHRFLRSHVLGISRFSADIAHQFLFSTEFSHLSGSDVFSGLVHQMSAQFIQLIENQLKIVGERMRDTIRMYSNHLRIDLPINLWMMSLVNPVDTIIPNDSISTSISAPNIEKSTSDSEIPEDPTEGADTPESSEGSSEDAPLEKPKAAGGRLSLNTTVQQMGQYVPTYRRKPLELKERVKQAHRALTGIQEFMSDNSALFNIADLVQGGYVNLSPIEWNSINYDYLRAVSYQLYIQYVQIITLDIEMVIKNHLIEYMNHQGMEDLRENVLNVTTSVTADQIVESMGFNKVEMEIKAKNATDRVDSLEKVLKRIKFARQVLQSKT